MADTAAHLVDRVLPRVPMRQWVLAFPPRVRLHLAYDARLFGAALTLFVGSSLRARKTSKLVAAENWPALAAWSSARRLAP